MIININHNDKINDSIQNVLNHLLLVYNKVNSTTLSVSHNQLVFNTKLQTLFNIKYDDKINQSIHELIMNHAILSEKMSAGGFDLFFEKLIKKINLSSTEDLRFIRSNFDKEISNVPNKSDIDWILSTYIPNSSEFIKKILLHALEYAGFSGKILIEKTNNQPSVELIKGYTFNVYPAFKLSNLKIENVKIVCLDGYVESVSEIHHLLSDANESQENCLLVVRGLSEDVKNTLKVNYDRGTLKVIPVIVQFDINGINSIKDISIASSTELISSNKGDLLSNVKLSNITKIKKIMLYQDKLIIFNDLANVEIKNHLKFLREKINTEKNDEVISILNKRIKCLLPNHVIIRIKDDKHYISNCQQIDYALRAIKSLVSYGWVEVENKKHLFATEVFSTLYANKCLIQLNNLGKII